MSYRIDNKFTFIHIPKNAGTSFRNLFKSHYHMEYCLPDTRNRHVRYNALAQEQQDVMLAVVRNPWDRAVSFYTYIKKKLHKNVKRFCKSRSRVQYIESRLEIIAKGFEAFVCDYADEIIASKPHNIKSTLPLSQRHQHVFLHPELHNTTIMRMENLDNDWQEFCEQHSIQHYPLPRSNTSRDTHSYREWYSRRSRDKIAYIWQADIKKFNYTF